MQGLIFGPWGNPCPPSAVASDNCRRGTPVSATRLTGLCGLEEIRTPYLYNANVALYQMSYEPIQSRAGANAMLYRSTIGPFFPQEIKSGAASDAAGTFDVPHYHCANGPFISDYTPNKNLTVVV